MKLTSALALTLGLCACSNAHGPTQIVVPPDTVATTTSVSFTGGTITAAIAATAAARDTGLMHVTTLAANAGMLFVYGVDHSPGNCAFWMKDTPLSLSIAFIDSTRTVINVDDMAPETTAFHEPTRACRYALEVNQGWLASHGVVAGSTVSFSLPAGTIIDP